MAAQNSRSVPLICPITGCKKSNDRLFDQYNCNYSFKFYRDVRVKGRIWLLRKIFGSNDSYRRILLPTLQGQPGDIEKLTDLLIAEKCNLCYAAFIGSAALLKEMLDRGCSIKATDSWQNTALHTAVHYGQVDSVKLLLEHGANVSAKNFMGEIPINYLSKLDPREMAIFKLLLEYESKWDLHDCNRRMQIYNVASKGSMEAIKYLLDSNVNFVTGDGYQRTILHYLMKNRNPGVFELFDSSTYLRNIDVNVQDIDGCTPLHSAVKEKNVKALEFLLDRGANINIMVNTTLDLEIPLFYAIKNTFDEDNRKCVEFLLERGADAQMSNTRGHTIMTMLTLQNSLVLKEIVLGHLALLESRGTTIIAAIRGDIEANKLYKSEYDSCKNRFEQMKTEDIYESITLFDLIDQHENKVVGYMRNKEIVSKINAYNSKFHFNAYCNRLINKRITDAIQLAELREQAAVTLFKLIDSKISSNYVIVYEIINYLSRPSLHNVINIQFD